jgi:hypothetical protein
MPRLSAVGGLARLGKLLLTAPLALGGRVRRARWAWQAGWRLGRLRGCWKHRVLAP